MRLCTIILASFFLLSACASGDSVTTDCLVTRDWSRAEQSQIADAYDGLPADSILRQVVREWISLHKQAEACNK